MQLGNGTITLVQNYGMTIVLLPFEGDLIAREGDHEWWLYLHNKNDHIESYDWNSLVLKRGHSLTATSNVRTYRLLESPYRTDCLDYDLKTEFVSRRDCIRKCMIKKSVTECSVVAHETDVFRGEPSVRFANGTDETDCVNRLGLNHLCHKQCPHNDCFKLYIEPIVLENNDIHDQIGNKTWIRILIPFAPKTTFTHKPSIEPIEFVCYMASTLSIWFGFSLLSVNHLVRRICMFKISSLNNQIFNLNIRLSSNMRTRSSNFKSVKHNKNIFSTNQSE